MSSSLNITREDDAVFIVTDCSGAALGDYNLGLAIASVFIILLVSYIGFLAPYVLSIGKHPYVQYALTACAFGGTAVLLTVGFVHILGDAIVYLSNPCLPQSFLNAYPGWASLFCVITIMLLMLVDYFMRGVMESLDNKRPAATQLVVGSEGEPSPGVCSTGCGTCSSCKDVEEVAGGARSMEEDLRMKRAVVMFVELSVCTHSIPVGLALGVQRAGAFVSLLVAITFHQILEGFGIGAATVDAHYSRWMYLLLATGFAITAPIGIVLGIILQSSFNTNSAGYLITVGVINACAAGMLIYLALEHMNAFCTRGKWLRQQHWGVQLLCFGVFFGAGAGMLVVGKYA